MNYFSLLDHAHLLPFLTDDPTAAIDVQLLCILRYYVCISAKRPIYHRAGSRRLRIQTRDYIITVIISLFSINAADGSILSQVIDENDQTGSVARIRHYVDYCSIRHHEQKYAIREHEAYAYKRPLHKTDFPIVIEKFLEGMFFQSIIGYKMQCK